MAMSVNDPTVPEHVLLFERFAVELVRQLSGPHPAVGASGTATYDELVRCVRTAVELTLRYSVPC